MRKIFFSIIFLVLILCLIVSTFLPQELARRYFYEALHFKLLWFIISVSIIIGIVNLLKKRDFGLAVVCLGFLLILLGGLVTSLLGEEGFIEIKEGQVVDGFWIEDEIFKPLDFSISLKDFSVEFHPEEKMGMRFVKSYKSKVAISKDGDLPKEGIIEVNRPLGFGEFSFYQYGYDESLPDQTILQVVKDPGVRFAYGGYLILFLGLVFSFGRIWKI